LLPLHACKGVGWRDAALQMKYLAEIIVRTVKAAPGFMQV
jgi:hypothetical protein